MKAQRLLIDPAATTVGRVTQAWEEGPLARFREWRHRDREPRPIYVCGATGSGTTVLTYKVAELLDVGGVVRESARHVPKRSFLHVRPIASHESLEEYRSTLVPKSGWRAFEARAVLEGLYRSRLQTDSGLVIDKGPNANLVRAGFFHQAFPYAGFILLLRDPVACIEGMRRKWRMFGEASLRELVRFYNDLHLQFLVESRELGFQFVTVSYEGLVADPQRAVKTVAEAFGLPERRSAFRIPARANVPGRGIRNVRGNRVELVADANADARARMPHEDRRVVEELTLPQLEQLRLGGG